ncbi:MAG: DUF433 domain-containing protein [Chloroflexi bacterium]|nr:DUF433 domain-containing protein [Chloroflexota bacterium]
MTTEIKTEHPHIVREEGIRGGRPCIKGTGITVSLLAEYYKLDESVAGILCMYPDLSRAAVHDALSYYFDHMAEIEQDLADSTLEKVMERHHMTFDERGAIVPRKA